MVAHVFSCILHSIDRVISTCKIVKNWGWGFLAPPIYKTFILHSSYTYKTPCISHTHFTPTLYNTSYNTFVSSYSHKTPTYIPTTLTGTLNVFYYFSQLTYLNLYSPMDNFIGQNHFKGFKNFSNSPT